MSGLARRLPRPHSASVEQRKYVYEVRIGTLSLQKPSSSPVAILWTRGSKTAVTGEKAAAERVAFQESLSLVCTLFREQNSTTFSEKLCTFAAVEQRKVGMLAGMRTLGKVKVDISRYASPENRPMAAMQPIELSLSKNSRAVGTLHLSIGCRFLSGDSTSAEPSRNPSSRLSDLSEGSEDGASSDSSSQCSESAEYGIAQLHELEGWPTDERQGDAEMATSTSPVARHDPSAASATLDASAAPSGPVASATHLDLSNLREGGLLSSPGHAATPPSMVPELRSQDATVRHRADCSAANPSHPSARGSAGVGKDKGICTRPGASHRGDSVADANGSGSGAEMCLASRLSSESVGSSVRLPHGNSSISSAALAGDRSRAEAERRQLEAQAAASLTLQRKVTARLEAERGEWVAEKERLVQTIETGRVERLDAQRDVRQKELEIRKLTSEVAEARAETSRLRSERETLVSQLRGGAGLADSEDSLAVAAGVSSRRDLEGKLAQSEKHRAEVARKMTKAHKRQENLLSQFEAEIELLSDKVEMLEEECCEAEQAKLLLEKELTVSEERVLSLRQELDRRARREIIQPAGMQELLDQIEMDKLVKEEMCGAMAEHNEELATLRVERAQMLTEKEEGRLRLRRSEERCRMLAVRMTKLEVDLATAENSHADEEEEKAKVFKAALDAQESRICELEKALSDAKAHHLRADPGQPHRKWNFL